MIVNRKSTFALLALLMLAMAGAAWAAGGSYDEEDPFRERRRIERFQRLGGDLTQEQEVELVFRFSDRAETREHHAQVFANKLRYRGYPKAKAQPCANKDACWLVIAPKRMRIDANKNIALSKELDQLAADDYGRYDGWDCELFKQENDKLLGPALAGSSKLPTLAQWLIQLDQVVALQCNRVEQVLRPEANAAVDGKRARAIAAGSAIDMLCTCTPERLKAVRLGLLPLERDSPITEAELTQTYVMPKVIQPCAAGMVRKIYVEECPTLAAERGLKAESYCGCMRQVIGEMSESDMAQLGLISADYLPRVAQAQKDGTQPPDPPPLYSKFTAGETACRK